MEGRMGVGGLSFPVDGRVEMIISGKYIFYSLFSLAAMVFCVCVYIYIYS